MRLGFAMSMTVGPESAGASPGKKLRQGKRFVPQFVYEHPDGRRVEDAATAERIRKLAIPPAWTDVWICPDAKATCRRRGATPAGASSTAITRAGARSATGPSTRA